MEFAYFCCLQQSRVRIWTVIYLFSLRQIQDRNRDSQLSLFLPFKWGLYSSDASSVSDVRDASNASPPTPWGHEACRWSLKPKPLPPLVSSHYPKLILRGEVYLSPPPLHWVVAPAFNICSDYSRSRNLMLSPKLPLKKMTFPILGKVTFLSGNFIPRRFSLEVSSILKMFFLAFSKKTIKPQLKMWLFKSHFELSW